MFHLASDDVCSFIHRERQRMGAMCKECPVKLKRVRLEEHISVERAHGTRIFGVKDSKR